MVRKEKIVDEISMLTGSRAHDRNFRFHSKCSEKTLRDFEAAVWRIDLRLAEMGQKDLLGQLQ